MKILAFESSCDETSAAVVVASEGRFEIKSNIIASQIETHRLYGGVVPEIASRAHIEAISRITYEALERIRAYIRSEYNAELDYSGYYLWLTLNSLKRYVKNRTPENKAVWRSLLRTYSNPVSFLFRAVGYCFGKLFRKLFKR